MLPSSPAPRRFLRARTVRTSTLFHESAGATWGLNKGEKLRFIVVEDVKGQTVTIVVETTPLGFEEFLPKAEQVVDSVKWSGS